MLCIDSRGAGLPRTAEDIIDQCGDIVDVHAAITGCGVAVSGYCVIRYTLTQHDINQTGNIVDVDGAVAGHIAAQRGRQVNPGAAVPHLGIPVFAPCNGDLCSGNDVVLVGVAQNAEGARVAGRASGQTVDQVGHCRATDSVSVAEEFFQGCAARHSE